MMRYAAVAVLAVLAACSEHDISAPATNAPALSLPAAVKYDTARGVIAERVSDDAADGVYFLTNAGDSLRLVGPVADVLAGMPGVEFWVEGSLTADGTMDVVSFAFRGADLGGLCQDPQNRVVDVNGKCRIRETGIKPSGRATWARRG